MGTASSEVNVLTSNRFSVGSIQFAAFGDRVLIQEDEFKSGYDCEACGGKGSITCPDCEGTAKIGQKKCNQCNHGVVACFDCGGKGALLIVPEDQQRRPTTGVIVSVGNEAKWLEVGMSVLYSSFAGHTIDLDRAGHKVVLRILHEPEVLSLVYGHLDLRTIRGKSEIAQFQN
jgi:hypothetical protein